MSCVSSKQGSFGLKVELLSEKVHDRTTHPTNFLYPRSVYHQASLIMMEYYIMIIHKYLMYSMSFRKTISHSENVCLNDDPLPTHTVFAYIISLVPRPSDWWAGREREGLVSTACACTVIIQILNNPITYRYFLVYLPFDLNSGAQRT
jgi:hypothetical protein